MSSNFPHFIQDNLIHWANLQISRNECSSLVLLQNLHFYEIINKQIQSCLDLRNTVLNKIQHKLESIEPNLNESQSTSTAGKSFASPNNLEGNILIGKYIYQNSIEKILYILLKCWDVMVVIKKESKNLVLQAEYENVKSFAMFKAGEFQVKLSISFLHNRDNEVTDFQETQPTNETVDVPDDEEYKKIYERIKMKKSELLIHQAITKKEFAKLKADQLFGCNLLRTPNFEEMQILSICGDPWIKVTADDDVVVGVNLVNNCSSELIVLQNFRALLYGLGDSEQTFKLYELKTSFSEIDSIENFFHISQQESSKNNCIWKQSLELTLRPEAFYVLILKLKINEGFFGQEMTNVPIFAFYDAVKANKTFNQECFLVGVNFRDVFTDTSCRLNFEEKHLQRDLLTIISTSFETEVRLEYVVTGTAFENYCCTQLGFIKISNKRNESESMDVDDADGDNLAAAESKLIFYNKSPDSVWHGTLLEITHINNSSSNVRLFTKSEEKSKIFFSLLRTNLKAVCGVKEVVSNVEAFSNKLIEFEAALRDECASCLEICTSSAMKKEAKDVSKKQELFEQLYLKELKTDLIYKDLLSYESTSVLTDKK